MRAYIIRRLLLMIPTIFLVSLIIFFIIRLIPGNIVDQMLADMPYAGASDRVAIEKALGLDVPLLTQYGRWVGVVPQEDGSFSGIFQGNLGRSLWGKSSVIELIASRWPVTFELG